MKNVLTKLIAMMMTVLLLAAGIACMQIEPEPDYDAEIPANTSDTSTQTIDEPTTEDTTGFLQYKRLLNAFTCSGNSEPVIDTAPEAEAVPDAHDTNAAASGSNASTRPNTNADLSGDDSTDPESTVGTPADTEVNTGADPEPDVPENADDEEPPVTNEIVKPSGATVPVILPPFAPPADTETPAEPAEPTDPGTSTEPAEPDEPAPDEDDATEPEIPGTNDGNDEDEPEPTDPVEETTPPPVVKPTPVPTPAPTPTPEPTPIPEDYVYYPGGRSSVLRGFNKARAEGGCDVPVTLSSSMTAEAQEWAEKLASEHRIYHRGGGYAESIGSGGKGSGAGEHLWNHIGDYDHKLTTIGIGIAQCGQYIVVVIFAV